jgi:hypothetical protein
LRAALFHGRPLVGGYLARADPRLTAVNDLLRGWPAPAAVELLQATGVRLTLEHPPLRDLPLTLACERSSDNHRLCVLPERVPIPSPAATHPDGAGPVVGVRVTGEAGPTVTLRCGETEEVHATDASRVLAQVRGVDSLDVFFEHPCDGPVEADVASVPLYADPNDPGWLPVVPAPGPGMAELFGGSCKAPVARKRGGGHRRR